jgi:hypothetical protein
MGVSAWCWQKTKIRHEDCSHAHTWNRVREAEVTDLSSSKFTPLANAAGGVIVKALVPRRHCRQYQR